MNDEPGASGCGAQSASKIQAQSKPRPIAQRSPAWTAPLVPKLVGLRITVTPPKNHRYTVASVEALSTIRISSGKRVWDSSIPSERSITASSLNV